MANKFVLNNSNPLMESALPAVLIDGHFKIISQNEAAKGCPLFRDGELAIAEQDRNMVLERLSADGYVSLRLGTFPYSGAVLNFVRMQDDASVVFYVDEELKSVGASLSTDGVEITSASIRDELHRSFVMLSALENEIGDNVEASVQLQKIKRLNYTMLRIAQAVGAVSRFQSNMYDPYIKVCDVTELVSALCRSLENIGLPREIPFRWQVPEQQVFARVDTSLLEQALIHVLFNAFKFTRDGNQVSLTMKIEGDRIDIVIRDRGAGIKQHNLEYVKNAYFSVDPPDDGGERPGIGVGLTIAEFAASVMGGTMVINSEFGEGTAVALTIPVAADIKENDVFSSPRGSYVVDRFSPVYIGFSEICDLP